jgi:hypothetical protein
MGISYYASVVYGVRETKAMRKARNTTIQQTLPVCSKRPQRHKIDRWRPPQFCSQCGGKVEERLVTVPYTLPPHVAYAAPGLDPEDEDGCLDNMQEWIHEDAPNCSDGSVVLGVCLLHKWSREDLGVFDIPTPTAEQITEVMAYVEHLGLKGATIQTHLIIGGM